MPGVAAALSGESCRRAPGTLRSLAVLDRPGRCAGE